MTVLKFSRGPSIQRAVQGLVAGLFGILWTVFAWQLTVNAQIPYVHMIFPLIGVVITVSAWGQAAYRFVHIASQQRFAEYDFVALENQQAPSPNATKPCAKCQADLQPSYLYCPMCGTKV